jgi:hypothetical protein
MKKEIDWGEVVRSCKERTCTLEEFAKERGVNRATLQYHLGKERKEKVKKFYPVAVIPPKRSSEEVVIEFSTGLRLSIRD